MWRKLLPVVLVLAGSWVALDLWGPRESNLRSFDPAAVARVETAMWRSYYDAERLALFRQLGALLRTQYEMPFFRSNLAAFYATRAAYAFQRGRNRAEYEKALPGLDAFFREIRKLSNIPFIPRRAARLELEWWIVHREREQHPAADLQHALANVEAEIYRVPPEWLEQHGRLRAEAMLFRDVKAQTGTLTTADWERIERILRGSWKALWDAVNMVRL